MITNLYSIYDRKSKIYNTPFSQLNDQVAMRTATNLVKDKNSEISKNPEDFVMFKVATYDDNKCMLEPFMPPVVFCSLHELESYPLENTLEGENHEV